MRHPQSSAISAVWNRGSWARNGVMERALLPTEPAGAIWGGCVEPGAAAQLMMEAVDSLARD